MDMSMGNGDIELVPIKKFAGDGTAVGRVLRLKPGDFDTLSEGYYFATAVRAVTRLRTTEAILHEVEVDVRLNKIDDSTVDPKRAIFKGNFLMSPERRIYRLPTDQCRLFVGAVFCNLTNGELGWFTSFRHAFGAISTRAKDDRGGVTYSRPVVFQTIGDIMDPTVLENNVLPRR